MQHWLTFLGSLRRNSYNRALLEVLRTLVPSDVICHEAQIASLPFYNPDLEPPRQANILWHDIRDADAMVFLTPEYNGSIPAVLKNAIDWASRDPSGSQLSGKPAIVLGASQGLFGTLRSQLHLRQILNFLDVDLVRRPEVLVSEAHLKLAPKGELHDPEATRLMRDLALRLYSRVQHGVAV